MTYVSTGLHPFIACKRRLVTTLAESKRTLDADSESAPSNQGCVVAMDDDPMTLRLLTGHLKKAGYAIRTASNGTTGLELIDESTAVALVDLRMPDLSGFDVLRHISRQYPNTQVIILTGSSEVDDAVEAMQAGAFQFVTKPFDPKQLAVYVSKGFEAWQLADENRDLKESHSHNVPVRVLDSAGDMHCRLMQQVDRIAELDSTVFIGGESGTGKSTIARMIHQRSSRAGGPFVTVNCASLPRDLLQSELFGHTKGSFTGAVKDRLGHAEVADGGTLFLDEIGDLPLDLQPKLLTFLQDRIVQRLGSSESRRVDVRLIAASHRDLAELCRENLFRQDLYFRLLVLSIDLPALRFRLGELPSLVSGILSQICERQRMPKLEVSESALELLRTHSWPGNIRELENVLERAVAFCDGQAITPPQLLFSNVSLDRRAAVRDESAGSARNVEIAVPSAAPQASAAAGYQLAGKTLDQIERDAIIETLRYCGGNKAKSARTLGISEKSIYNKMRRLQITPELLGAIHSERRGASFHGNH